MIWVKNKIKTTLTFFPGIFQNVSGPESEKVRRDFKKLLRKRITHPYPM